MGGLSKRAGGPPTPITPAADRAAIQHDLALTLHVLGERSEGSAAIEALDEALAIYRLALGVRTRDIAPAEWAATQRLAGVALRQLGKITDASAGGRTARAVRSHRQGGAGVSRA